MAATTRPTSDPQFPTFLPILPSANHRLIPVTRVSLRITSADIRKMDYHLNECPISNPAVQNAIAEKLRLLVRADSNVSVTPVRGSAIARIGKESYDLGTEVGQWLESVYMGLIPKAQTFSIELPLKVISKKVLMVSNRDPRARRDFRAAG